MSSESGEQLQEMIKLYAERYIIRSTMKIKKSNLMLNRHAQSAAYFLTVGEKVHRDADEYKHIGKVVGADP